MQRRIPLRSLVALLVVTLGVMVAPPAGAASGDLDVSFSGDGYAVTTFPGGGGTFYGVALDGSAPTGCGQGGIILIGVRREGGALDPAFSGDGRLRIDPFGTDISGLQSCTYLADGRLLGVGWFGQGNDARMLVAVFTPQGKPDPRFSGDGFAVFKFPGAPAAFGYGVAVQPDGRIVVVGETYDVNASPAVGNFGIARLTPRGTLDPTFSGDGRTTVAFGPQSDGAWKVGIDSERRLVVAGWARDTVNGDYDSAVVVLRPGGKLDAGFGDDGKRIYDLWSGEDDYVNGLDLRHDDRIVLGTTFPGGPGHAVVQLRPGGGYDGSFGGGDGIVENVTPAMSLRDLEVHQRRIVFAGEWSGAPQFVRLRPLGNLDGTFGTGGVAPIPELSGASVSDLTHDRDGRIVASGNYGNYPLLFRIMA